MKRSFLSTILCGALVGFSGMAFADTTENDSGAPAWRQGGPRGGQRNGQRWGGQRNGMRGGQRWGGRGGQRGMGFGGMILGRISKESEIQQKFPKEYAEIARQLIDAENKLQDLAKKAKVELPVDNNNVYRQLKTKAPAEFAEIETKLKSRETMREGFEKLRTLAEKHGLKLGFSMGMGGRRDPGTPRNEGRPSMRRNDAAKVRAIREKFPREWEQVNNLRREGKRREAEDKIRELMQRLNGNRPSNSAEK